MAKKKAAKKSTEKPVVAPVSSYQVLLFQGGRDTIGRHTLLDLQDHLDSKVKTHPSETEIDVWIDSPGGDAHAAFKMYLDLRSRCNRLRVMVPDYAKSAATLFAIGADELFMSPFADLGPIDAQIEHPDREGEIVSSLSGANSLEYLTRIGTDLAILSGPRFIQFTGLPRENVMRELLEFTSKVLSPVLSKLDPQLIHEASESLQVTKKYAEIVLKTRIENKLSDSQIEDIAKTLVGDFPTHGYVIDRKQLDEIGIESKLIAEHDLWSRMKKVHNTFANSTNRSILEVFDTEALKEPE